MTYDPLSYGQIKLTDKNLLKGSRFRFAVSWRYTPQQIGGPRHENAAAKHW